MVSHHSRFGVLAGILAAVAILMGGNWANGQEAPAGASEKAASKPKSATPQYRWMKVDPKAQQNRKFVISGLRRGFPTQKESIDRFNGYFTDFGFRRLIDPKYIPTITDVRREFQRDLRDAKGKAFPHLNRLAFRELPKYITNRNFHPIARYNATLMFGDLNQAKATPTRSAIPLIDALPALVNKILMDPNQIDAVRVAALIGIRRHAEAMREHDLAVLAAGKPMTTSAMLKIVGAKKAGKGRSEDGHQWMRRQAIEILGEIGEPGPGGLVAKALVDTAADKASPLWVRCAAAGALGQLKRNPSNPLPVDAKKLADTLSDLVADVCIAEVNRAKGDKTGVSQQQLLADLGCVQAGLESAGEPKDATAEFVKRFNTLYKMVASAPRAIPVAGLENGLNQFLAVKTAPKIPADQPTPVEDDPDKEQPKPPVEPLPLDDMKAPMEAPGDLDF